MSCSSQKLCNNNDCSICFNKSFSSHKKSRYWDYELNDKNPREVFQKTNIKYWFKCKDCIHVFESSPNSIVLKNRWCPYCSNQKLCFKRDCLVCFNKSAQNLEKIKFWNYKLNKKHPRLIYKSSAPKRWFTCGNCDHDFEISLNSIKNSFCPYCSSPPQRLCNKKECNFCFEKSFASHEKSEFWNYTLNNTTPRDIFQKINTKYWFDCDMCHVSFKITLRGITSEYSWCSCSKNKTETMLKNRLKLQYKIIKFQPKFEWCKNTVTNRKLPFDFLVNKNTIIELDGDQHFKNIKHWKSDSGKQQDRDNYKMERALDKGFSVIRILQERVWKDSDNWEEFLNNAINFCEENKNPCIVIQEGTEDLYENHTVENFNKISLKN
jgi:very-short-patch-repair endonuclease